MTLSMAFVAALLTIQSLSPSARLIPWEQTIRWDVNANADTGAWESPVRDSDGHEHLRVSLIPLWSVEGGVVAFEIVLALPENPRVNLLGQRQLGVPQATVIDAKDLQRGTARSPFGKHRSFEVATGEPRGRLEVTVLRSRLGKGAGTCDGCPNIQELSARVAFRTE